MKQKVEEAVDAHKHYRFFFNLDVFGLTLTEGVWDYLEDPTPAVGVLDPSCGSIDTVQIRSGVGSESVGTLLLKDPIDVIATNEQSSGSTGLPTHYARRGGHFYVTPAPDETYNLGIYAVHEWRLETTTDDENESSVWINNAEQLIRSYTKALIYGDLLRNDTEQSRCLAIAGRAFSDLVARSSARQNSHLQPIPWE